MVIKAIIVDDEEMARTGLRKRLVIYPEIKIVGEAENGLQAVEKINNEEPDIIFLDIQMPGLNGFEVIRQLKKQPVIIFTTAYDEFAVKAFDKHAVAYLLKPIDNAKLARAIERSKKLLQNNDLASFNQLFKLLKRKDFKQFVSKLGSTIKFISKEDVCFIDAKDKHTFVHLKNGKEYLVDHSLNALEDLLDDNFFRIHRSYFINVVYLHEAEKVGNGRYLFTLNDAKQTQIQSSSSYAPIIRKTLNI